MLTIKDLSVSLVERGQIVRVLVKNVSLSVPEGSVVCLVGESGSGKSLTGYAVTNLMPSDNLRVSGGSVEFLGKDLHKLSGESLRAIRGADIALIPQDPLTALNPVLTVGDQLAEMFRYHTGLSSAEIGERCAGLLDLVKIDNVRARLRSYPHQLSGGQRQRILIAMAMALGPKLIIADEPTTALDVSIQGGIIDLFMELRATRGLSFLFITHDFGIVRSTADFVYVMYGGRILEEGPAADLFRSPLHPYTRGLISAVPSIDSMPKTPLPALGSLTAQSLHDCPFYERCGFAEDACRETIEYRMLFPRHRVLCRRCPLDA